MGIRLRAPQLVDFFPACPSNHRRSIRGFNVANSHAVTRIRTKALSLVERTCPILHAHLQPRGTATDVRINRRIRGVLNFRRGRDRDDIARKESGGWVKRNDSARGGHVANERILAARIPPRGTPRTAGDRKRDGGLLMDVPSNGVVAREFQHETALAVGLVQLLTFFGRQCTRAFRGPSS